jgi:hypothetical protein
MPVANDGRRLWLRLGLGPASEGNAMKELWDDFLSVVLGAWLLSLLVATAAVLVYRGIAG